MSDIVRVITSPDSRFKVEIFRRPGGTYGFRPYHWHDDDPDEPAHWCQQGQGSESVTASPDDAEREARLRFDELMRGARADA